MITLITGGPGAGKTAWTVQEITRLPSQRKLYVHGIPELKIAHEPIFCLSELCEYCRDKIHELERLTGFDDLGEPIMECVIEPIDSPGQNALLVEDWYIWASHGSLIIIDEVQRVWRPTNSSQKLTEDITALETHRHKGLDFWLISQGPHLFHSNIRLLVGRHIHLLAKWNGRSEYEWPECRQNITSRSDAVTRPYTLPKKIFGLYKSSSLHVKQTHRKPLALYGFGIAVLFLVIAVYFSYQRVIAHFEPSGKVESVAETAPAVAVAGAASPDVDNLAANNSGFPDFKPLLSGVYESAPAYAHLIKVTTAPILKGCIKSKKKCICYTDQATVYPATLQFCELQVEGQVFNPYLTRAEFHDMTKAN
jgi:zona occludens toxin